MIVTDKEVQAIQTEYKKNYQPFRPYQLPDHAQAKIGSHYQTLITTQNGMDTDDYCINENNKVSRYMNRFYGRALLLGVGTGREVQVAKSMGLDTVGITLGSRNVDFGRSYLGLNDSELLECAIEALPFSKETFDVVAGFQIFEHFVSPLIALLELGRVMKNEGTLILEWPPANEQFSTGDNPHHQICYTPGQAEALLLKAGFRDIKLYYDDMEPIPKEEYWKGDQKKMLVIEGVKKPTQQEYIRRAWNG